MEVLCSPAGHRHRARGGQCSSDPPACRECSPVPFWAGRPSLGSSCTPQTTSAPTECSALAEMGGGSQEKTTTDQNSPRNFLETVSQNWEQGLQRLLVMVLHGWSLSLGKLLSSPEDDLPQRAALFKVCHRVIWLTVPPFPADFRDNNQMATGP